MESDELAPCPLCGGTSFTTSMDGGVFPDFFYNDGIDAMREMEREYSVVTYTICCDGCGCSVQGCYYARHGFKVDDMPGRAKRNAIYKWNTRWHEEEHRNVI